MSTPTVDQSRPPRLGDRIQMVNFPFLKGRIIEFRGPIGYKGRELYGIELQLSEAKYTEAPRDRFELLDDGNDPDHPYPASAEAADAARKAI